MKDGQSNLEDEYKFSILFLVEERLCLGGFWYCFKDGCPILSC